MFLKSFETRTERNNSGALVTLLPPECQLVTGNFCSSVMNRMKKELGDDTA
jgi:hypothetical protein